VSGIADAEQARKMPSTEPVDLHRQQFNLIPIFDFSHAIAQVRCDLRDILAKRVETSRFELLKRAFADDQSGLKITAPCRN
jgi:hypothetical protein